MCSAIVLHPDIDSTHFRPIYGTRHLKGVEVFKAAEQKAMPVQEDARARACGKKLESKSGLLFGAQTMGCPQHYLALRQRYLAQSRRTVVDAIHRVQQLQFDELYATALQYPLVWEADLRDWLSEGCKGKHIQLVGLKADQRVPKHSQQIRVQRLKQIST